MALYQLVEHGRLYSESASLKRRGQAKAVPDALFDELHAADLAHAQRRLARERLHGGGKRGEDKPAESYMLFKWEADTAIARSWVGVLQVPGAQVEVMPKVNDSDDVGKGRSSLVMMLTYAGRLKPRSMGAASVAHNELLTFLDVLIEMFAEQLEDELRRGVDRGYVQQAADLEYARGRIDVKRQIVHHAGRPIPLACVYDSFEADTALNRALKYACRTLARRTSSFYAQRLLRGCMMSLEEVSDVVMSSSQLGQIQLNRQNERYGEVLELARLLLSDEPATPQPGSVKSFSLCFDMNRVYEQFVAGYLRAQFEAQGITVSEQGVDGRALWFNLKTNEPRLKLLPDVILERGGQRLIIDAKWKRLDKSSGDPVAREDLYQLHAYASAFNGAKVVLLYPKVESVEPWRYRSEVPDTNYELFIEMIDVLASNDSGVERITAQLRGLVPTG